jgi:RNA polymerase sigma-70 factor (ECF subfamily)
MIGPIGPESGDRNAVDGESSFELLERFRAGEQDALDVLLRRHLPKLRRWASHRIPPSARGAADTEDLVQETVILTLRNLKGFEYRREGALQAYLRQAVMNRIRDLLRSVARRPQRVELDERMATPDLSPLEAVIGHEAVERYEAALATLTDDEREAIIGRIELGYDYQELAQALDKPSADAARMAVRRATLRLAARMTTVR